MEQSIASYIRSPLVPKSQENVLRDFVFPSLPNGRLSLPINPPPPSDDREPIRVSQRAAAGITRGLPAEPQQALRRKLRRSIRHILLDLGCHAFGPVLRGIPSESSLNWYVHLLSVEMYLTVVRGSRSTCAGSGQSDMERGSHCQLNGPVTERSSDRFGFTGAFEGGHDDFTSAFRPCRL